MNMYVYARDEDRGPRSLWVLFVNDNRLVGAAYFHQYVLGIGTSAYLPTELIIEIFGLKGDAATRGYWTRTL